MVLAREKLLWTVAALLVGGLLGEIPLLPVTDEGGLTLRPILQHSCPQLIREGSRREHME